MTAAAAKMFRGSGALATTLLLALAAPASSRASHSLAVPHALKAKAMRTPAAPHRALTVSSPPRPRARRLAFAPAPPGHAVSGRAGTASGERSVRVLAEAAAAAEGAQAFLNAAFSTATFAPQPFFLLMVLLPRAQLTKGVMGSPVPILALSALHLSIVLAAASQDDAVQQIALFADVFNPSGFPFSDGPFRGMQRLFEVPGFIAEEWPHVLAWDLFVARMIWLDGLSRGVFTAHSILLCNFIGPPGLLLHALTCLATGRALPDFGLAPAGPAQAAGAPAAPPATALPPRRADALVSALFSPERFSPGRVADACAPDVVWEDLSGAKAVLRGREEVLGALSARPRPASGSGVDFAEYVVDRVAEGAESTGFTWHREVDGSWGLRGTTFVELDAEGRIKYVREIAEPLLKPGASTEALLRALSKPDEEWTRRAEERRASFKPRAKLPSRADEMVKYLWLDVQGAEIDEVLKNFGEDVVYEDFNFPEPFRGKDQVSAFLNAFNIPGITFVPEKFSEGETRACFTWHVEIAGVPGQRIRGVSFYETGADGRVSYVRDIPESAVKPPPVLALASALRPGLRRFSPASPLYPRGGVSPT